MFNFESFNILFKEKSSKYISFDICNCKWNYKSARTSSNGGMECENHIEFYLNFSFIDNCQGFKTNIIRSRF